MKEGQRLWTREELALVINLYSKMLFGKMHKGNPDVIRLALLIGRTPDAVAYKLVNFASLDPKLQQRGIKGMSKTSELDRLVWNEYMSNWDSEFLEAERLLANRSNTTIVEQNEIDLDNLPNVEGLERERIVNTRINQQLFRKIVFTNYNGSCCMTGINIPSLLVASHIIPWSESRENRLKPTNGLLLNFLHDKAFDKHLITVTEHLRIKVSKLFYMNERNDTVRRNFIDFDGKDLLEPKKFNPDIEFLRIHNELFEKEERKSLISD